MTFIFLFTQFLFFFPPKKKMYLMRDFHRMLLSLQKKEKVFLFFYFVFHFIWWNDWLVATTAIKHQVRSHFTLLFVLCALPLFFLFLGRNCVKTHKIMIIKVEAKNCSWNDRRFLRSDNFWFSFRSLIVYFLFLATKPMNHSEMVKCQITKHPTQVNFIFFCFGTMKWCSVHWKFCVLIFVKTVWPFTTAVVFLSSLHLNLCFVENEMTLFTLRTFFTLFFFILWPQKRRKNVSFVFVKKKKKFKCLWFKRWLLSVSLDQLLHYTGAVFDRFWKII